MTRKGHEEAFREDGKVLCLDVHGAYTTQGTFVKIHQNNTCEKGESFLKGVHSVYELHISQLTLFLKLHNIVTDPREPTDGGKDKPSERSIHDNQGDVFRLIFY